MQPKPTTANHNQSKAEPRSFLIGAFFWLKRGVNLLEQDQQKCAQDEDHEENKHRDDETLCRGHPQQGAAGRFLNGTFFLFEALFFEER
jgi:hypothetical protein